MEVLFGDHAARLNDLEGVLASRDNVVLAVLLKDTQQAVLCAWTKNV